MQLPFRKKKPLILDRWEYEPYAFTPGIPYVIEVDITQIDMNELRDLQEFFFDHGVNVKIVPNKGTKIIQPVAVKRMTRIEQ